ncbi:hypothetical protein [Burkholderia gladioli]|uniref:hypothetical protein n=1 Tax=Burkholderia gladioli TaxID=28095 RepID=UPI001641D038|nr:hypothetical protein [Burkholderia gladioli]
MNSRTARPGRPARRAASLTLAGAALLSTLLSGCNSLYSEGATAGAGIAGAAVAAKVTNNAAVATGIGLGVVAAARAGVQYTQRVAHTYSQGQIADAAGRLEVGGVARWSTHHTMPIEDDEFGRVTVSRLISVGPLDCKEIVFSVDSDAKKAAVAAAGASSATAASGAVAASAPAAVPSGASFYVATICRDGPKWKWASAEPATGRWGALQ